MTLLHQAAQKAVEAHYKELGDAWIAFDGSPGTAKRVNFALGMLGFAIDALVAQMSALQQQPEPVAWVPYCHTDCHNGIEGEYRWNEVAEKPFAMSTPENWECRAIYTAPPALQHQEVPREPVAWLNPSSGKTCSADEKFSMENHQGMPGKAVAAHFSDPLYASPSTTRQQEVGSGCCEIEDCPELNLSNYDEDDVARLNDWAVRADAEIDRLHLALTGIPDELEKELGACSISRAMIGDRTHDRRDEKSNRGTGEEEQHGGKAGRCDATRASGAELGACSSDTAQHEVMAVPGPSAQACWRPIATAPEDTHILIATTGDHVGTAYWTDEGDGKVWAWGHPQRDGGDYVHTNLTPIGWMPLPAAPSTPENAGGVDVPRQPLSEARVIDRAHRRAWRFKMIDAEHGCTTYLFRDSDLIDFARDLESARGVKACAEPRRWHELKTDPSLFDEVASGRKTWEIRLDDRDYIVGDGLILRKTLHSGSQMRNGHALIYVGEPLRFVVTHVLTGYGLQDGWCGLSIRPYGLGAVVSQTPPPLGTDGGTPQ